MANQRGESKVEIDGEEYRFYYTLKEFKEIEEEWQLDAISDLQAKLNDPSFSDIQYLLKKGLRDFEGSEEDMAYGLKSIAHAVGVISEAVSQAIGVDLTDENIPEDVKDEIENKMEAMQENPTPTNESQEVES